MYIACDGQVSIDSEVRNSQVFTFCICGKLNQQYHTHRFWQINASGAVRSGTAMKVFRRTQHNIYICTLYISKHRDNYDCTFIEADQ